MPPALAGHEIFANPDTGVGLNFLIGTDYEKRKNKLIRELELDYRQHVAKEKYVPASEHHPQPQALSLPIEDKVSVQIKLREERNREYNLFLQQQAQNRRFSRGIAPVTTKDYNPSRSDAASLAEAVGERKGTGSWPPGHKGRRRWKLIKPREQHSSEDELNMGKEEEHRGGRRRRTETHTPEKEKERRVGANGAQRALQDTEEMEAPGVHDQNNNEWFGKPDLQMPDTMRTSARSRPAISQDEAKFASGLMIGRTEEKTESQQRKEQYRQELLKQIAEQQRNKIREKKLDTGVTDPEREPSRITHWWHENQQFNSREKPGINEEPKGKDTNPRLRDKQVENPEHKSSSGNSQCDYSAALTQVSGTAVSGTGTRATQGELDYFNEDYHRDFSNMLGDVVMPRVAAALPPVPPALYYASPHDAAYYYYGPRIPLYPHLPRYQNVAAEEEPPPRNLNSPLQRRASPRPSDRTETTGQQETSSLNVGEVLAEKSEQRRENKQSYQEELRQQIKEKQEQKRREKEEKERYDAVRTVYNPWGRSGGGAPIRDQNGNLVSNLCEMHRKNEEKFMNPISSDSGHSHGFLKESANTPQSEAREPLSHQHSGFIGYKEELKQQIEERRRKQDEERERMRIEEEKEEKRVEEQRARMRQQYEEERRAQRKKTEQLLENPRWSQEHQTQNQKVKNKTGKEPDASWDGEEKMALFHEREPSPPVPTLRKKQTPLVESRPASGVSQLSSQSERSVSAPTSRAQAPPDVHHPQTSDDKQEVIRRLSALRRYLRNEKKQLEMQLVQTDRLHDRSDPPGRPKGRARENALDSPHTQDFQPSARNLSPGVPRVDSQNISAFNQLQYRDTASPHEFPYLDIEQKAALRQQRRKIRRMKGEEERDFWDQEVNQYDSRTKPGRFPYKEAILPSQSAFIDVYTGGQSDEGGYQRRPRQSSAKRPESKDQRRKHYCDEEAESLDRSVDSDAGSLHSEPRMRPDEEQHNTQQTTLTGERRKREGRSVDEDEASSLRSGLGRCLSVDTVATEPWLRPGTSEAVKRAGCRERADSSLMKPVAALQSDGDHETFGVDCENMAAQIEEEMKPEFR